MPILPTGTVTFLFTDIEGSTRVLQELGDDRYSHVLVEQRTLLRAAFQQGGGQEVDTQGDAFFVAFPRARDAVLAAVTAQRASMSHAWPDGAKVGVRMGLHTGEPLISAAGYVGIDVHRAARICAAGHGGQILLSETTRDLVTDDLPEGMSIRDLGEHRLKDLARPLRLFQVVTPDFPVDFPPLKSLDALPNNLPRQLTSFVGREREIAEVKRLLSTTYLLTLTGAGGAGKTRLALQVGAEILEEFKDGVWLVELAQLSDPDLVPQTVGSALSVREQPGRPMLTALTDYLQNKHLLLLVDNCEHLVTACARLADALLRTCTYLRILATSREPLGIAGESAWRVPSLSLPDPHRLPPLDRLPEYEAVRLFVERATAALPTFRLMERNARAVADVCERLDGIPLAVELAAARVKALSVEQIAARLNDRLQLLTGGSRTALPRHQTLQAAMDWSYDLLSEKERILLSRLAVFSGGFVLEAAEAVCPVQAAGAFEVLDLLTHLVDKSLVLADDQNGTVRYRLLETVRHYAQGKLEESGEAESVRRRHRDMFLALAEEAEPHLMRAGQAAWFKRLDVEHDNLRAALGWSMAGGEAEVALRLAGALWWFWYVRGHFNEGRKWLDAALSVLPSAPTGARMRALYQTGFLAFRQGDFRSGAELGEQSLALSRQLGDKRGIAFSLLILAGVHSSDYGRGAPLCEESLAMFRDLGDHWGIGLALTLRGVVALNQGDLGNATRTFEERLALGRQLGDGRAVANAIDWLARTALSQGNYERAGQLAEESLALAQKQGDNPTIADSLNILGRVALYRGEHAKATALSEEALSLSRHLGEKLSTTISLTTLAMIARLRGDYDPATALFAEGLTWRRALGWERVSIPESLEGLAGVASAKRQPERGARLFGAAEALRENLGIPLSPPDRPAYDRDVAAARSALKEAAFARAWAEGRAMTLEEAVEYALVGAADA